MKLYRVSQEQRSVFWEVIVSATLSKKSVYVNVIFLTVSEVELFHCTVPKVLIRNILRTVSNSGIYCSSDRVYLV
jgi:hypothetical protein